MRFFLVDGLFPAVETSPGSMDILDEDNTWGAVEPDEVLSDERSPEVAEAVFAARVALLGGSLPAEA